MNTNDQLEHSSAVQEEQFLTEFIGDLFWEGPFGEADCAGL
jgi:hypothetical protein